MCNFGDCFVKKLRPNHWDLFFRKKAPNAEKYCPIGEISPNLVTLPTLHL
jgi:hypothetical protein